MRLARHSRRRFVCIAIALIATGAAICATPALAQEARRSETEAERGAEFGRLFDAVVEATQKSFWDRERLAQIGWEQRAAAARQGVVEAPSLDEAALRINTLLGVLKTSHTVLLTPDDVDYYVLRSVFGRPLTFAGIGLFSVRIDGRDFVDLLLETYPAERAGLKVGDEIVSVDGKPYHPIRSFRGKIGDDVAVTIRRTEGGPTQSIDVDVVSIAPLTAFNEATLASARAIERDGRRIGYVHVWASLGDSEQALAEALAILGAGKGPGRRQQPVAQRVDAVVIDMRGKIGGSAGTAGRYLEIIDPRGPNISWRSASKSKPPASNRGRTAVLIDHHTRSTAELFVHSYKRERQGPLIGTTTAGAVSGGSAIAMPGDSLLHVAVSGLVVDGDIIEGSGVAPDVMVPRPLPYSNGADPVLDAAVDLLARSVARNDPVQQDTKGNSQ